MVRMYVYTQNEVPSSASRWLWLSVVPFFVQFQWCLPPVRARALHQFKNSSTIKDCATQKKNRSLKAKYPFKTKLQNVLKWCFTAKVNIFSSTLSLTCFLNIFEILENVQGRFPIKSSINPLSIFQVNLFKPLVPIFAWKELLSLQMTNYAFPLRLASPCATTMLGNWDSYLSGDALITQKRVTPKFIV